MATIDTYTRKDGTITYRVYYRHAKKQRSLSFDDPAVAERFKELVSQVGPERAEEIARIQRKPRLRMTVADWVDRYIDHLTGVDERTPKDYRSYVRTEIRPAFGAIPLEALTKDDVAKWVQAMRAKGVSAKTIANKHGLLSAALAAAVAAGHIPANPAGGTKLPTDEKDDPVFLEHGQYHQLLAEMPGVWQPLVDFLVTSGCRWSEATALRPSDVSRVHNTVRIVRAWKRDPYRLGPPKTPKSIRTINVPKEVLDNLDYTGAWLFTNPGRGRRAQGGPVRAPNFRSNVWTPAVARTWPDGIDGGRTKSGDLLLPRIHDLRHTCASWLIQLGRPLPAIQEHLGHESIKTTVDIYGHLDRTSGQGNATALATMLVAPAGDNDT
ncbi:site-specific recombinase XerD [Mycobacterium sp. BK086]|uniref:tyrosine-type recombinase/integrase n=1 Tax=Mycobacterium sp. BK086 TaxID=2512165 RepID=UPI00105E2990|nr:site-specific integrase [Mycobacterium sp. BK086]TDO18189.1 site-specific recombinase XerD [Mycobacterium sp. BK086]